MIFIIAKNYQQSNSNTNDEYNKMQYFLEDCARYLVSSFLEDGDTSSQRLALTWYFASIGFQCC